ncbi:hypothetical protein J2Z66_001166 [Paenibacillus eucommiae]|uniref:Uncharacterized protein n=1 Tax=Paenibacillus eucommiae TaxID=1355755 RepID=A0ABS4IPS7_9BACL|nr:hypothetical protein [Paenibacillus eucommiae]
MIAKDIKEVLMARSELKFVPNEYNDVIKAIDANKT